MKYVKIEKNGIVYYMNSQYIPRVFSESERYPDWASSRKLLEMSEFAIDTHDNTLIKCRRQLVDVFDNFLDPLGVISIGTLK